MRSLRSGARAVPACSLRLAVPLGALVALALAAAGCPATNAPQPMPPAPPPAAGYEPPIPEPAPPAEPTSPAEPAEPAEPDGGVVATPAPLPDGASCLDGAACASGVCEGQGCGDAAPGRCAPARRACTKDRRAYCGCDGVTFYGSGSCPGRRYSARAACPSG